MLDGKALVVDPEQVQDRRLEVSYVYRIPDDVVRSAISGTDICILYANSYCPFGARTMDRGLDRPSA